MNDELIVMSCENSLETFLFEKSGGQTWCLKYTGHDLIEKLIICQEFSTGICDTLVSSRRVRVSSSR